MRNCQMLCIATNAEEAFLLFGIFYSGGVMRMPTKTIGRSLDLLLVGCGNYRGVITWNM